MARRRRPFRLDGQHVVLDRETNGFDRDAWQLLEKTPRG
jgi:hypothetical protein